MDSKEHKLVEKLNSCKTRKCSKLIKKRNSIHKKFEKAQAQACPQKSNTAFYRCSSKFFEGSNLEKVMKNIVDCSEKKCVKEIKSLKKYRNKQNSVFIKEMMQNLKKVSKQTGVLKKI